MNGAIGKGSTKKNQTLFSKNKKKRFVLHLRKNEKIYAIDSTYSFTSGTLMALHLIAESRRFVYYHAAGMALARPYGLEIYFVRNPISRSAAWLFVFEIIIYEKKFFDTKQFHF